MGLLLLLDTLDDVRDASTDTTPRRRFQRPIDIVAILVRGRRKRR
jgi:hypothetical protein